MVYIHIIIQLLNLLEMAILVGFTTLLFDYTNVIN